MRRTRNARSERGTRQPLAQATPTHTTLLEDFVKATGYTGSVQQLITGSITISHIFLNSCNTMQYFSLELVQNIDSLPKDAPTSLLILLTLQQQPV